MCDSIATQLRFPTVAGFTVRAGFEVGAVSSDFGAVLLQGMARRTGLIARLAWAIQDRRHPSYIAHSLAGLLRERVYHTACGYADGNHATQPAPVLCLCRLQLEPQHTGQPPVPTRNRPRQQPMTLILKLFKLAVRVVQYKDRIKLHLPSTFPVKKLLHRLTDPQGSKVELLCLVRPPARV
ncbi:hypothetical protein ELQ36_02455 [Methylococcus capsulatus]|nr:hypothetical protein [Methylococcus capsulatus]